MQVACRSIANRAKQASSSTGIHQSVSQIITRNVWTKGKEWNNDNVMSNYPDPKTHFDARQGQMPSMRTDAYLDEYRFQMLDLDVKRAQMAARGEPVEMDPAATWTNDGTMTTLEQKELQRRIEAGVHEWMVPLANAGFWDELDTKTRNTIEPLRRRTRTERKQALQDYNRKVKRRNFLHAVLQKAALQVAAAQREAKERRDGRKVQVKEQIRLERAQQRTILESMDDYVKLVHRATFLMYGEKQPRASNHAEGMSVPLAVPLVKGSMTGTAIHELPKGESPPVNPDNGVFDDDEQYALTYTSTSASSTGLIPAIPTHEEDRSVPAFSFDEELDRLLQPQRDADNESVTAEHEGSIAHYSRTAAKNELLRRRAELSSMFSHLDDIDFESPDAVDAALSAGANKSSLSISHNTIDPKATVESLLQMAEADTLRLRNGVTLTAKNPLRDATIVSSKTNSSDSKDIAATNEDDSNAQLTLADLAPKPRELKMNQAGFATSWDEIVALNLPQIQERRSFNYKAPYIHLFHGRVPKVALRVESPELQEAYAMRAQTGKAVASSVAEKFPLDANKLNEFENKFKQFHTQAIEETTVFGKK